MRFVFGAVGRSGPFSAKAHRFPMEPAIAKTGRYFCLSNAQHNRKHVISWIVTYLFVGANIYIYIYLYLFIYLFIFILIFILYI